MTGEIEMESLGQTRWGQTCHGAKPVSFKFDPINEVAALTVFSYKKMNGRFAEATKKRGDRIKVPT